MTDPFTIQTYSYHPQYTESRNCKLRNLEISEFFKAVRLCALFVEDMTLGLWAIRIPGFRDNAMSSFSRVETSYPEPTGPNM